MSDNNTEQMDMETTAISNENPTGTAESVSVSGAAASPPSVSEASVPTISETTATPTETITTTAAMVTDNSSNIKLSIKTPKDKKDISIDADGSVKQVIRFSLLVRIGL